jgi:putative toxin-antitoxin system antitoxin component (TIGR02293 family)
MQIVRFVEKASIMKTSEKQEIPYTISEEVPQHLNESEVLYWIQSKNINWNYLGAIKQLSSFNDETISEWLNISVRTFRSYKESTEKISNNLKEQVLLLVSLLKHGNAVFGSKQEFGKWLSTPNFFFDNHMPANYLTSITGIRFIEDRLTALEFGDNI